MRNMKSLLLTAAALALSIGAAQAADGYDGNYAANNGNPYYISLGAGWNHQQDSSFKTGVGRDSVGFDEGWLGEVAIGHAYRAMGQNWRTELEGSYRHNNADGPGSFRTWNAMVNQYYDFKTNSRWTPYIGAGIGASFQHAHNIPLAVPGAPVVNDDDTRFAYQGIAGIDYWSTQHSTWGLRYNYFGALRGKFDTNSAAVGGARADYNNHAVLLTYRYNWGAAPQPTAQPAAYVAPAPAPQQTTQTTQQTWATPTEQQIEDSPYKIFFANDSHKLTKNAQQVIRDAATAAGNQHSVVLHLTSNTDTTGSQAHNDKLSEQRAESVRQALIKDGISPDMINVVSNAERDLPVPTADGVKEPRNRVVTIVLQ